MPITVVAIRKRRADKRKRELNLKNKTAFKSAVTLMRKKPTPTNLKKVFSLVDRAAKKHTIHQNRASRLKSRLSKLLSTNKKK